MFVALVKKISQFNQPSWEESIIDQEPRSMSGWVEIPILGLYCIRSQENGGLCRAIDLVRQDGVLHLQVKHLLQKIVLPL